MTVWYASSTVSRHFSAKTKKRDGNKYKTITGLSKDKCQKVQKQKEPRDDDQ